MYDHAALLDALRTRPTDSATRAAYAAWLDGAGQPQAAAMCRGTATDADRLALAADYEARLGCVELSRFAVLQIRIADYEGRRTTRINRLIEREYATTLRRWRQWLPPEVTTLGARADRSAYNRDYFYPAVCFPTRRGRYACPVMAVAFSRGLPLWVECDAKDYERAGRALLVRFPWVEWKLAHPAIAPQRAANATPALAV